jgi:hypothetical protein
VAEPDDRRDEFWSGWYRLYLWVLRYVYPTDVLQFTMAVAAGGLAVNSISVSREATYIFGSIYVLALFAHFSFVLSGRRTQDRLCGEIIWGLFHQLNERVFQGDHRTRFTLFRAAPLRPGEIIPWFRYQKGGTDAVAEARRSRAHYGRDEGATGRAWTQPGFLFYTPFQPFRTEQDFLRFYVDEMKIRPRIADRLSDYMRSVETIFTMGIVDSRGHLLGVLSLDFQAPITQAADGTLWLPAQGQEPVRIEEDDFESILNSLQSVLESFSHWR